MEYRQDRLAMTQARPLRARTSALVERHGIPRTMTACHLRLHRRTVHRAKQPGDSSHSRMSSRGIRTTNPMAQMMRGLLRRRARIGPFLVGVTRPHTQRLQLVREKFLVLLLSGSVKIAKMFPLQIQPNSVIEMKNSKVHRLWSVP